MLVRTKADLHRAEQDPPVFKFTDIWHVSGKDPDYDAHEAMRILVFKKIQPKKGWAHEIDCLIDESDLEACKQACFWFTGSCLNVIAKKQSKVHVTATGYYAMFGG